VDVRVGTSSGSSGCSGMPADAIGYVRSMRPEGTTRFGRVSHALTTFTGSGAAMVALCVLTAAWVALGVTSHWDRSWELVVTGGAPLLTLALLIVLQHSQNRNARALHIKLNELLAALEEPDDDVVTVEDKPDDELERLEHRHHEHARKAG
jgi:low affinity Fe/Cu permease